MNQNHTSINTRKRMVLRALFFILCSLFFSPAGAQTFTQRVQQKGHSGEGTVTVTQDKAIDDLVNGQNGYQSESQKEKEKDKDKEKEKEKEKEKKDSANKHQEAKPHEPQPDTVAVESIDTRRKVMRGGYKVNGYRVQAFAGGNQRKDRQKAEQVGNTIKANYPDTPVYVHFYSPRWICRVGNYRTYEEAHEMLMNIRNKLGISGASIVKGKITVPY